MPEAVEDAEAAAEEESEEEVALELKDGILMRRNPSSLTDIGQRLAEVTGLEPSTSRDAVENLLNLTNDLNNTPLQNQKPILPFKLNQFISQTGSVYITLDPKEKRVITLDGSSYINGESNTKKPLYPIVFSRTSGTEFVCVKKNYAAEVLEPREFNHRIAEEEEDNYELGYIVFDEPENPMWTDEMIINLPDSWIKTNRNGDITINKDYKTRIPQKIYFDVF